MATHTKSEAKSGKCSRHVNGIVDQRCDVVHLPCLAEFAKEHSVSCVVRV